MAPRPTSSTLLDIARICSELQTFLVLLPAVKALDIDNKVSSHAHPISQDAITRLRRAWSLTSETISSILESHGPDCSTGLVAVEEGKKCERRRPTKRRNACKTCRKRFATEDLLKHHVAEVHGIQKGEKEYEKDVGDTPFACCQMCYSSYRNVQEFKDHHRCQSSPSSTKLILGPDLLRDHNRFTCGLCKEEFRQFLRIEHHLVRCRGPPFPCEICGVGNFDSRKSLNDHKSERHKDCLPFLCDQCPRKFKLNTSLQKHLYGAHERRRPAFQCDRCTKRFQKKIYLTNHQTRFHNLSKNFLCQTCGERFVSSVSLKSHLEIHEGTLNFPCPVCGRAFRRKDKLEFHMSVHTGERPHQCDECSLSFARKSKLIDHQRRHKGEKRFSCLKCNKMFSGSGDLRRHLARHHPSISSNIKPNVPLTPQIVHNIVKPMRNPRIMIVDSNEGYADCSSSSPGVICDPYAIDIEDLREVNVAIQELEFNSDAFMAPNEI